MDKETPSSDLSQEPSFSQEAGSLRLEKLVIEGFKSFASRIQIQLQPGITAIVGPNGCGKSNIVDAIRWVLGEPSSKSLRAESMQDVLFAGAQGQNAASLAQVSLQLSGAHPSRPLLIDRFEIERRLFRTGESEYKLNKRSCRLRDIHELFADTGLGRHAFAIFEQGRIEQMVMMSAAQRRLLIEEAAGIAGFKIQKKEALSKWQTIDVQLQQIQQVYQELDLRLINLKEQAKKALQWQSCQSEIERLARLSQIHKWNLLEAQGQELSVAVKKIENELSLLRSEREKTQERLGAAELAFDKEEQRLALKSKENQLTREQAIEAVQALKYLEIQRQEEARSLQSLSARLVQAAQKKQSLSSQISQVHQELDQCQKQFEKVESSSHSYEEELERQRTSQNALFKEKQTLETQLLEKRHQKQLLEEKRQSQKNQKEQLFRQITSHEQSLEKVRLEERNLQAELEKIIAQLKMSSLSLESADQIDALKKELSEEELLFEEEKRFLSEFQIKRKQRQAHLVWLQERIASCDKALLNWLLPQLTEGHRSHIQPLSPFLAQEISSKQLPFWKFLEPVYLVHQGLLADLTLLFQQPQAPSFALWPIVVSAEESFERACQREIKQSLGSFFEKRHEKYWQSWGDRTVRVDDLGVIWSMDQSSSHAEILQEIPLEQARLEEELAKEKQCLELHEERKQKIQSFKTKLQFLEKQLSTAQIEHQKQSSRHDALEGRLGFLKEQMLTHTQSLAPLKEALEPVQKALLESDEMLAVFSQNSNEQEKLQLLSREVHESQRKFHSVKFQKEAAEREKNQLLQQLARVQAQIHALEESLKELEGALVLDEKAASHQRSKVEETQLLYEKAKENESLFSRQSQKMTEELEKEGSLQLALKNEIKELQKKNKSFESRLEQLQNRLIEERKKWDEIQWNKQGLEASIDIQEAQLWDGVFVDPTQLQVEIGQLKTQQQELGFVNFAAAKELKEIEERHGLILTQMEDVQSSKLELMRVIAHLDEKCRLQFQETFCRVRESFARNFAEIFEGGLANLLLSGEEESQGVEIQASPPGKQIRSLGLMSGGEKCLTAVALMMALFEVRPAPFCLLDEIDAPLDDTNVEKLIRLLRHYSHRTQIFIITHNKQTMAAASTLLGVSMPKRGVSQLFVLDVGTRQVQAGSTVDALQKITS